MKVKKNVAVIGLGKIGIELDLNSCNLWIPNQVMTHARAAYENSNFELIYLADSDPYKIIKTKEIFKNVTIGTVDDILRLKQPDLVIISVPTSQHMSVFNKVIESWPHVHFLLEKPVGANLSQAKKIFRSARLNQQKIYVNYFRRYLRNFGELIQSDIFNKRGKLLEVFISASGTLRNIYSHFIDLVFFLEGNSCINFENSYSLSEREDSTIVLKKNDKDFFIFKNLASSSSSFAMKLTYENYVIDILNNGRVIKIYNDKEPNLGNFEISLNEFNFYQKTVLEEIFYSLDKDENNNQIYSALLVHRLIDLIESLYG